MSSQPWAEIRQILDQHFAEPPEAASDRYWYPLSQPTYGADEVFEALDSMCQYRTSMGTKTRQFEEQFADFVGAHDAVMVNSGSSADLLLAYLTVSGTHSPLSAGDEVLVPSVTWPTQIWPVLMAGLQIRLVDADPKTFNMDFEDLERKITSRTKAIFAVHLMGNPVDMQRLQQIADAHGLLVLEDCCESLGARWQDRSVGQFGLGASFSFFFSHHMTTMEGGMVTCRDAETADQLRILRAHGWTRAIADRRLQPTSPGLDPRYTFTDWGFNVRPTEVQASFGLHQLKKLPSMNAQRNQLAEHFWKYVDEQPLLSRPETPDGGEAAWFALPLLLTSEAHFSCSQLLRQLEHAGVETRPVVAGNLARQPAARLFGEQQNVFLPGADQIHEQGFYVGLSPQYDIGAIDRLTEVLDESLRRLDATIPQPATWRKAA